MRARILPPTLENLKLIALALKNGELVGLPTETVYGLAANGFNPVALAQVFETKERPTFDPLIVHVGPSQKSLAKLEQMKVVDPSVLSLSVRHQVEGLMQAFWPGPLTLILPKHPHVPDLVTSGLPSVGVRMPVHPVAQNLLEQLPFPLAAPSANRFGRISPTSAQAVADELGDRMDWILDGGPCGIGVESTILLIHPQVPEQIQLLRSGGVSLERLQTHLGFSISRQTPVGSSHAFAAPGMLESHYAPGKPFLLFPKPLDQITDSELICFFETLVQKFFKPLVWGVLLQKGAPEAFNRRLSLLTKIPLLIRSLSEAGDLKERAHRLFSEMRGLDATSAEILIAEPCAEENGLAQAISDRLTRASAHSRSRLALAK
ncbi:MAG: L-threonylcarbamoyladenylate synthase [Bdellovibrionia bacterium]